MKICVFIRTSVWQICDACADIMFSPVRVHEIAISRRLAREGIRRRVCLANVAVSSSNRPRQRRRKALEINSPAAMHAAIISVGDPLTALSRSFTFVIVCASHQARASGYDLWIYGTI